MELPPSRGETPGRYDEQSQVQQQGPGRHPLAHEHDATAAQKWRYRGKAEGQLASARSSSVILSAAGSTSTPGPMVELTATDLMYRPLAAAGFARLTSSM